MATIISREDADKMVVFGVGANYASNEYVVDGNKGGIALNDIASGADGVVQARCVVEGFKKAAGATWTEGQYLYFDPAAKAFTTVVQADGLFRGRAYKDALLAAVVGDVEIIEPISDGEGKMDLAVPTAATNVATLSALGQVTDSGVLMASVARIAVPVAGHTVAGLTAAGGLETTGILTADVLTAAVPTAATNVATLNAGGHVTDSTVLLASLTGKMEKAVPTAATNVATLDAAGQITDSTVLLASVARIAVPVADHTVAALTAAGGLETTGILTADVQVTTVPVADHTLAALTAAGKLETSGVLTADIAGAVTMGGIYNDQMRNSTNTAQSLADATAEIIDLEDVELAGDVTYAAGTTSLATIPATGLYVVNYSATFAAGAGTYNNVYIYVNGAEAANEDGTPDNANPITVQSSDNIFLTATDTVGLWCKQDSGGALNVTAARMAIQRIQ